MSLMKSITPERIQQEFDTYTGFGLTSPDRIPGLVRRIPALDAGPVIITPLRPFPEIKLCAPGTALPITLSCEFLTITPLVFGSGD